MQLASADAPRVPLVGFRCSTRGMNLAEAGSPRQRRPAACKLHPRPHQKQKKVEMTKHVLFLEDSSCYNSVS
jgi:hypothetical protein